MAKWTVTPGTANNTMSTQVSYEKGEDIEWKISQNTDHYVEQAKIDRETMNKGPDRGYKKFATIPDIVAIEIKMNHGIDLHADDFFHDVDKKAKFMLIIRQEYPYLLSY